jgi:hypothetical protein
MARFCRVSPVARLGGAALVAVTLAGCRPAPSKPADSSITPAYDEVGRLNSITYDRNHDGKPDAWLKMRGAHVISAELDENFDGKVDRREFYSDGPTTASAANPAAGTAATPAGTNVERVEQSTLDDGTMNRVEFYEHGKLARVEEDTNGDGRVDKWETWTNGMLVMVALDTRGTGKPDRRIVYSPDGGEPRMEVDTKGDGTFAPLGH